MQACTLHAVTPWLAFCSILKFVFTAISLSILCCVHVHTYIYTYLYPWVFMQAKILLFCLYLSSLTKTTSPSHQLFPFILVVSHADHLFKLLYSSIWEILFIFSCRMYWKISKSVLWILLTLVSCCGERLRDYAKRTRKQEKYLNKQLMSKQVQCTS